jgi:formylmethanofuran dehydrogenase subunit E
MIGRTSLNPEAKSKFRVFPYWVCQRVEYKPWPDAGCIEGKCSRCSEPIWYDPRIKSKSTKVCTVCLKYYKS